jgi:pyruvate dehydrogenase E1 component beta subunit
MALAMEADERVILMGEDIGVYGGAFQVTGDLVHRFGPERVIDTPISELGGAGVAVGAALTGMRPIFEFQFSDFATLAMEQIVNQAAKMRYMLCGEVSVPVIMRLPCGSGSGAAAQHSQSLEAWFAHVPGLKVIEPTTPYDAKGMLLAALEQNDPVLIFEHKLLYKMKGHVPEGHYTVPIGPSETRRRGKDVTIVATAIMVARALEAAVILEGENIDVEVIDLIDADIVYDDGLGEFDEEALPDIADDIGGDVNTDKIYEIFISWKPIHQFPIDSFNIYIDGILHKNIK